MQVIEMTRASLVGALEARVLRLLGEAFFDGAMVDYYARLGVPEIILILQDGETVAGHLALYRREVGVAGQSIVIGMIGGVAIAPACRGRGHARALVERAHAWLRDRSVPFSLLFA